jgi:hypothetical protein
MRLVHRRLATDKHRSLGDPGPSASTVSDETRTLTQRHGASRAASRTQRALTHSTDAHSTFQAAIAATERSAFSAPCAPRAAPSSGPTQFAAQVGISAGAPGHVPDRDQVPLKHPLSTAKITPRADETGPGAGVPRMARTRSLFCTRAPHDECHKTCESHAAPRHGPSRMAPTVAVSFNPGTHGEPEFGR